MPRLLSHTPCKHEVQIFGTFECNIMSAFDIMSVFNIMSVLNIISVLNIMSVFNIMSVCSRKWG